MTAPRVSEEEAEHAIRSIDYEHSGERLNYWKSAQEVRRLFRALLAERSALEARLVSKDAEIYRLTAGVIFAMDFPGISTELKKRLSELTAKGLR